MNKEIRYFKKELFRHYSTKVVLFLCVILAALISPVIVLIPKVKFDPAEFVNLYLSTIFTSILIALLLNIVELYKSSLVNYKRIYGILETVRKLLIGIKTKIEQKDSILEKDCEKLQYYKNQILTVQIAETQMNEAFLLLYSSTDLNYIVESINGNEPHTDNKRKEIILRIELLLGKINEIIDFL